MGTFSADEQPEREPESMGERMTRRDEEFRGWPIPAAPPKADAIPDWVVTGVSFYEVYEAPGHTTLWHVRGIVDDAAVCRRWLKTKQRWQYVVFDWTWFHVLKNRLVHK